LRQRQSICGDRARKILRLEFTRLADIHPDKRRAKAWDDIRIAVLDLALDVLAFQRHLFTGIDLKVKPDLVAHLYAADLTQFRAVSQLDIDAWPTVRILSGRMSPSDLAERFAARVETRGGVPARDEQIKAG